MLQRFTKRKNLLMAAMLLCFCAFTNTIMAQTWDISDKCWLCSNNVTAILNQTTGLLTISGKGNMADFYDTNWETHGLPYSPNFRPPWYNLRSSIRTVVISDGVTNIGDGAFDGCSNLNSVTIPTSVVEAAWQQAGFPPTLERELNLRNTASCHTRCAPACAKPPVVLQAFFL